MTGLRSSGSFRERIKFLAFKAAPSEHQERFISAEYAYQAIGLKSREMESTALSLSLSE